MPANLSPDYRAAEAAFRKSSDPRERLDGLREMLRTIPKHKGTEHLQAGGAYVMRNASSPRIVANSPTTAVGGPPA